MVRLLAVVLAVAMCSVVLSKPVEDIKDLDDLQIPIIERVNRLWKRFVNPALVSGDYSGKGISRFQAASRLRTKRSEAEDCEKLQLCKLHASSSRNFLAAYELYFVNKENAHLWDHQTHTLADCNRRFAHCFGGAAPAHKPKTNHREFRDDYRDFRSDDYEY